MNTLGELSRRKMLRLTAGSTLYVLAIPLLERALSFSRQGMIQRQIPSSGEMIPIVGMGTWQTFDAGNDAEARSNLEKILLKFYSMGGRVMDSSPMYGSSEEVLGDLALKTGLTNDLFIATKVWTKGKENGLRQMEDSELKLGRIDLMQVHNLVDFDAHINSLRALKESGRIRYIGITHYMDSAHEAMVKLIKREKLDFIQVNYSILSRHAADRLLPVANDYGVAVLINRPYEGGRLFRQIKGKELPGWAQDYQIESWGQFFLKFILSNDAVTAVIPATTRIRHLVDNMGAGIGELPDEKTRMKMADYFYK
jgi:diketogulonate reductase-like aldo/keto reductase